jgi:single-stranded-DNA-specific exonuclease
MAELALLEPTGELAAPASATSAPPRPPLNRRIDVPPYDLGRALVLERELGIGHVLAQVLVRRGIDDPGAARQLLDPRERYDPSGFSGLDFVLATIEHHLQRGSRITVHGDYDVDGVCATAVLVRALRSRDADVGWYLPSRSEDGYGLSLATVQRLAARGTGLLITVDCGITAVEEVAAARAAGIEVIVTDHHSPRADGQLPDCPIFHPGVCGYPAPALCGAAVAHKLAEALGAASAEQDIELVALATVADLVPLQGENRRIVREGLAQMAGTERPGLRALMEVSRTDPSALNASCLGFRLAPRINAAGRLRRADAGLELLLTDDPVRAKEIALELDSVNAERRAVEQRIGWEAEALAEAMGERSAYVLAADGWHPGVIGIVASRIVERYHRPAVLIALAGAGPAQGSGRSIPGFDLLAALDSAAPHLIRYGGHRAAAGLNVLPERVADVREAIEAHAAATLTPDLLDPVERVDAIVSGPELSLRLAEEILALEPCGMGNPGVNLLVTGARFDRVRPMGDEGRHAKFSVSSGGARATAVCFGCDGKVAGADGEPLDATFRLERNVWSGVVAPRLLLRHARECVPAGIEVVGEPRGEYLENVMAELDRPLHAAPGAPVPDAVRAGGSGSGSGVRTVLDRRGESPLAVLADAGAAAAHAGASVLAVCADVARRLPGLASRTGGFALTSHRSLLDDPGVAGGYRYLVVLDPPACAAADEITRVGTGYTFLAWGAAELRFSEQMHELEYGLRASLKALYRNLRSRERVAGEELERLLRGEGSQPRSAHLAARLIRVLTELELVSLDGDLPALAIASTQPTQLERAEAFRVYSERYEEGLRFLNRARPRRRT